MKIMVSAFLLALVIIFPYSIYGDVVEDSPTNLTIAGSATDLDKDPLVFSVVDKITSGTNWLVMASDGSISGIPTNDDVGTNTWTIRAEDGHGGFDEAKLHINVINTNDPPYLNFTTQTIHQGYLIDIDLNKYLVDIDPTADILMIQIISGPKWISVNKIGRLLGIPSYNYVGKNSVLFRVKDNHGSFTESKVSIIVDKDKIIPVFNEIIFYN